MKFSKYIAIVFFYSYFYPVASNIRRSEDRFRDFWHFHEKVSKKKKLVASEEELIKAIIKQPQ
jgi:hypothetical protein